MLHWSLMFLIFALIAAVLGFGGLAGAAVGIAKILFFVFLIVWLIAFLNPAAAFIVETLTRGRFGQQRQRPVCPRGSIHSAVSWMRIASGR